MNLKATLEGYNAIILKEMLRHMYVEPKTYKADNINLLIDKLSRRRRIRSEIAKLSDAEKITIARVIFMNNEARSKRLKNQLLQDNLIKRTPERYNTYAPYDGRPNYKTKPAFEDLMAKLLKRGLVFSHTLPEGNKTVIGWSPGRYIIIPEPILEHIDQARLPSIRTGYHFEPTFTRTSSVVSIQRDISNYVRFARRSGVIKLTTQGILYKTALREIAALSSQPSNLGSGKKETHNGYLLFLRRILSEGELLEYSPKGLIPAETTHKFWAMDSAERIEFTYNLWRDTTAWNGLRFVPSYYHGNDITTPASPSLTSVRKSVLTHLKRAGRGWISLPSLLDEIQNKQYGFMFPERECHDTDYYYYSQSTYGTKNTPYVYSNNPFGMGFENISDEEDGWDKVEAAYINHLIAGPLYWLGLVDLGYHSAPDEKADFTASQVIGGYQLTDYGEWLLGLSEKPDIDQQEGEGGIVLQPNFEILAMQPITVDILMTLDSFAQMKDSQQHVTTYELTRDSVYRGQQGKWPVPNILDFFKSQSKMPIPNNVKRTLEEWDVLHNRITIRRNVSLADAADSTIATEIAENLSNTRMVTDKVLLSNLAYQQLVSAVRKEGYLPLQTLRTNVSASNSIHIHDDGRIVFLHRVPSIFTTQMLADISIAVEPSQADGAHRLLIPAMLKGFASSRAKFNELLSLLKRLSKAPLNNAFVLNLKAWSNYYGNAKQAQLILIEFRDHQVRDELCQDPDLRNYLSPFQSKRPLAVVSSDHLELVNKQLARRGVKISEGF
ncbi:MAG: helicase-associated domain-containing protein [Candidatus Promineifilaceae bacterium]